VPLIDSQFGSIPLDGGNGTASALLSQPALLSPETGTIPASSLRYHAQECLLRPPSPADVAECAIGQLEPSVAIQPHYFTSDQPNSNFPCQSSSSVTASTYTTDVSDPNIESGGVHKRQRIGIEVATRLAYPAKADESQKLVRLDVPSSGTRATRYPLDHIEADLDNLICGRHHGANRDGTGTQLLKLPTSQVSRYMFAREPVSGRAIPADPSWRNTTLQNSKEIGQRSKDTSCADEKGGNSRNTLHHDAPSADSPPTNPPGISLEIGNVLRSARSLPVLPIMVNTSIYNKRHLCSALNELQFQLYGHDHLEADFIINLKTACVLVPLAYITSNADELVGKLVALAFSFETLIVIFELYPSRTNSTNQAALPDPWSPSTRVAFD
jgi:hypothetical protein